MRLRIVGTVAVAARLNGSQTWKCAFKNALIYGRHRKGGALGTPSDGAAGCVLMTCFTPLRWGSFICLFTYLITYLLTYCFIYLVLYLSRLEFRVKNEKHWTIDLIYVYIKQHNNDKNKVSIRDRSHGKTSVTLLRQPVRALVLKFLLCFAHDKQTYEIYFRRIIKISFRIFCSKYGNNNAS